MPKKTGRYSKVVKKKKKAKGGFLPEAFQAFIARRLIDSTAFILGLTGICLLAAIFSYTHTDPSWNTASAASSDQIGNWIGLPGAYISDFLIQTIGYGGSIAGLILLTWGVRVGVRQGLFPFWKRFAAALLTIIFFVIALARIPAGDLLLHPYLGGSGGTLMLDKLAGIISPFISGNEHLTIAVLASLMGLASLTYALAISKAEWAFVLSKIKEAAIKCYAFSINTINAFCNWLSHYGDPEYQPPTWQKRTPKISSTPEPAQAVTPPMVSEEPIAAPEPINPKIEAPIRVVSPKKEKQQPAPKSVPQSSFVLDGDDWELPPIDLLNEVPQANIDEQLDEVALRQNADLLQTVLSDFNINGEIVSIHPGPVVTLYELEPAPGVKSSRVISLADDIARSMSAVSVRCAVIPGRNVIGIELPNAKRQTVFLRELLETSEVQNNKAKLPLILGKDIGGGPIIADLAKMPHLLIAGTTGSGKSVAVNTMVLSLVYNLPPEKCRLIMIDPKMLELSVYDDIPHLLSPVVTEPGKAVVSLKWAVQEMENRYRAMSKLSVRNIEGYNARLAEARKKGETLMRKVQTGFDPDTGKPVFEEQPMDMTELPYIVIFVDEFADLMLVAGKDVESAIQRLAQMARAAGIHLIMATQRPSTDVITGVIKANFPTRISFQVTSVYDSRTILGETGAEQLLGMGDMLYMASGGRITRVHGPFVADEEVEHVVSYLKEQGEPQYLEEVTEGGDFDESEVMAAMFGGGGSDGEKVDELYDEAVAIVAREGKASTSFIQRCLQIGYNRAARIIEEMERQGVVSKATATGKRDVLISDFSDA